MARPPWPGDHDRGRDGRARSSIPEVHVSTDLDPLCAAALLRIAGADLPPTELLSEAVAAVGAALPSSGAVAWVAAEEGFRPAAAHGAAATADLQPQPERWRELREQGGRCVVDLPLRGGTGQALAVLTVVTALDAPPAAAFLTELEDVTARAFTRADRVARLERRNRHFVEAQRISHVGSYDFEIASNTNDWSDQLYRIYGREPQSFNASYERFLEMVHPDDREKVIGTHQEAMAAMSAYEMDERIVWPDGTVRTLASWGEVVPGPDGTPARMVGICWDVTDQRRADELSLLVHDAEVRRRHAVELNDNVVQGLASIVYQLELGRASSAMATARFTLATARSMAGDLLGDEPEQALAAGHLVRERPSGGSPLESVPLPRPEPGALRVVVADDAADLRVLLRLTLTHLGGVDVVGEAEDGRQAVAAVARLRPDVLLLDLSMPVMDGLEAIPLVREASPDTKILVLSGFDADRMAPAALDAGAHGYLEKGRPVEEIALALSELFPERVASG
jgi:CheY-like chemotaxis protein/PAS domain-containing protein